MLTALEEKVIKFGVKQSMNILLDTHIMLWTLTHDNQLPQRAIDLIADENNKIYNCKGDQL